MLPEGWLFFSHLSGDSNVKLTAHFLDLLSDGQIAPSVRFGHATVPSYPDIDVPHPLLWLLCRYGTISFNGLLVRLSAIVNRLHEPALTRMPGWHELQSSIDMLKGAVPVIKASADEIFDMWQALIQALATTEAVGDDSLSELWNGAARDKLVPVSLPAANGDIPLTIVFVTGSPDLAQRARNRGHVAITLDAEAISLWIANGARDLSELMKPEWIDKTGPPDLLISMLPELREVLRHEAIDVARCQPVDGLKLIVAGDASPVPCLIWDNILLLDMQQLASQPRVVRLRHVLAEAAAAGWLKHDIDECLRILGDAKVDELRAHVAQGSTLAERLLRAVGNRDDPLRQALGNIGGLEFLQGVEKLRLAELVLAQLGPVTLTVLRDALDQEGLKPPSRWSTAEARSFVSSIGFPEEFAASPESRREAEEFISGPIDLPPLHDFQDEVLDGIRDLISSGTTRRRAVISLPTGAGKTRVTVEAAVSLVLKLVSSRRSVLWIAQTDELCEQAVQAYRQVWLNLGSRNTDLRIIRLWGGNPNPVIQESDKPIVVVASIQTMNSRMGSDGLDWLRSPGLVVVDECHHAITPSYTNLLRFLDAEAPRQGEQLKDESPILGLSATPFRTDDEESQRLARRFDNRWLPFNQEDLYHRLRRQGVLSEVLNEAIESGIGLTPEEMERLSKIPEPWEGIDFENLLKAINERLAGSKERNERLVDRIKGAVERSILFFTNSVMHAEEMAARLNLEGLTAAAVSGDTSTAARRYFISRFQRGDVRVLCNHSVLGTGFDAPKIDMVLISRAVFSPVRYMQMVGRGLRGEKNGGKPVCKIVTVMDNLGRFQDRHPYHYCQRYFTSQENVAAQNE
jgi:superfamily II DNA or RNA helicase